MQTLADKYTVLYYGGFENWEIVAEDLRGYVKYSAAMTGNPTSFRRWSAALLTTAKSAAHSATLIERKRTD